MVIRLQSSVHGDRILEEYRLHFRMGAFEISVKIFGLKTTPTMNLMDHSGSIRYTHTYVYANKLGQLYSVLPNARLWFATHYPMLGKT